MQLLRTFARIPNACELLDLKAQLVKMLRDLKAKGHSIAGYGAPAKATTLLNFIGVGNDVIDYTVDRSIHKQGRYIPGVRVPIAVPEKLTKDRPDYALLFAWNLADEIMAQQRAFRDAGGQFIIPIPKPRIV